MRNIAGEIEGIADGKLVRHAINDESHLTFENVNDLLLRVPVLWHTTPGRQRSDHLIHRLAVRDRTTCDPRTNLNGRIFLFHLQNPMPEEITGKRNLNSFFESLFLFDNPAVAQLHDALAVGRVALRMRDLHDGHTLFIQLTEEFHDLLPWLEACAIIGVLSVPKGLTCSVFTCFTLPATVWRDRQQALAGPEWRTLQFQAAPSLAPRRRRPRDLADSLDTQSAPEAGWRRRPTAAPPTIRLQAAPLAARQLRASRASCARPRRRGCPAPSSGGSRCRPPCRRCPSPPPLRQVGP